METNNHNSPKYAFLYMLSLAALIFTGFSVGMIAFQIINKYVPDAINQFRSSFDTGALRFALSALIVAAPVFFITNYFIYKGLYKGALTKDSGVRKWLTYFILLVSSVVILGWFIGLINTFLVDSFAAVFPSHLSVFYYNGDFAEEKEYFVRCSGSSEWGDWC